MFSTAHITVRYWPLFEDAFAGGVEQTLSGDILSFLVSGCLGANWLDLRTCLLVELAIVPSRHNLHAHVMFFIPRTSPHLENISHSNHSAVYQPAVASQAQAIGAGRAPRA